MRRVAVTGLGVVSPVGNSVKEFWNSLTAGRCGVGFITKFDTTDYKVKVAAEVKNFDPACCMSKSEVRKTDLFSQYALAAADQAMSDSGLTGIDPRRLGVYVGSGIGGIHTIEEETEKLFSKGPSRISPYFIPKMIGNMAAGNIAIRYNAQGPCLPVVTACATSSHTVGEAFRAIRYGYADAILAGGAEASVLPLAVAGFINCMALSTKNDPLNSSLPFDKRRDGFVIGEGAGILVLEEYEHAVSRGAKIYAEVTGYGNTCDAYHPTAPHPEARGGAEAIRLAAEESGIGETDVLYINAHGTGTPLNDKTETLAIKKALPDLARKAYISSTKSMTGHMLGAAGAVEAIASVLALSTGTVPPTIGYRDPDPDCDLNYVPNQAVQAHPNCAVSISLGFGGHNACVAFRKEGKVGPA
ncbi:beta-ketoacyl-[acyl-carrier-protein] synthase II [Caproiciproducens sp. NJN-50]|uniref:beta-ketoacyl-ACP synthase II n=1 Tax=Acutalibacteraceae TaxID=3082771 RepID=UPI000FFE1F01|nr:MULTISPECIES: beta-ketoacyl-ACP synthase II [Acutalibacteraceae]QAT49360.1 beta-ketoacyl-[acyl-carrier-protein] synthase II [Caproiciproducens sp. NJN-50]